MHELRRLDLLLQQQLMKLRATRQEDTPSAFRGLVIAEAEVDTWLGKKKKKQKAYNEPRRLDDFTNALAATTEQIEACTEESIRQGVSLRLPHLAAAFGLSQVEVDAILICLAPALDLRYQKLYAYLQDDVTRKKPTVDLVLDLLYDSQRDKLDALARFAQDAPLRRHQLVSLSSDPSDPDKPLLAQFLTVDERIVDFLLGRDRFNPHWDTFVYWDQQKHTLDDLVLPEELRGTLNSLCDAYHTSSAEAPSDWMVLFHGPDGAGKRAVAQALCHSMELPLLIVDMPTLLRYDPRPMETFSLLLREAQLCGAAIYLAGWQHLTGSEETTVHFRSLLHELEQLPGLVFLGSTTPWQPLGGLSQKVFVRVAFPAPSMSERLQLWETYVKQLNDGLADQLNLSALAATFRFTGGQIVDTLQGAYHRGLSQGGEGRLPTMDDLYRSCRAVSTKQLGTLARHIVPKHTWEDLVLPRDSMAQLRELSGQVRHRLTVYDEWGFDLKLSLGKGLIALFSGPSGTGKTFAAEIIAEDLGMDLYQIDLSCVVSKYVGETEKNLSQVFQEAEDSNAILFFDEADALFGKRTEVRDAHDRYANIEVNYLLQRIEDCDGVVILATNMRKNIDEAFLRRMQFTIDFPFPDEDLRLLIWQGIFPLQAPVSDDADLSFLARQFRITGGNIKNIALAAAFRAAGDGGVIHMKHLVQALKREYQKLGKICEKSEFCQYYDLVR